MLVTKGLYKTPAVDRVRELRSQGMTLKEIARETGLSAAAVSSFIPYTTEFHGSAEPSKHAAEVRQYRAYEKSRKSGQEDMKKERAGRMQGEEGGDWKASWKKETALSYKMDYSRPTRITWENLHDLFSEKAALELEEQDRCKREREERTMEIFKTLISRPVWTKEESDRVTVLEYVLGLFPGALCTRNRQELEELSGERLPFDPASVWRLHLEMDYEAEWHHVKIPQKPTTGLRYPVIIHKSSLKILRVR